MFRPAWGILAAVPVLSGLLLSGCGNLMQGEVQPAPMPHYASRPAVPQGPPHVALLLPLTGPNAAIAAALRQAAQLAAAAPGAPILDIRDTGGDPARAAEQAQAAIAGGDTLILGPLTAAETQAVAAVSVPSNIAVLSFSSDPAVAEPGVWTLGITPGEQIRRLIGAARAEGRQHLAALLPSGPFGDAMQVAILAAAGDAGFPAPTIERGGGDPASLDSDLKTLSDYEARRGDLERRIAAMRQSGDPAARQQAAMLAAQPVQPPPFDTLVLAANGDLLSETASLLVQNDVLAPQVRIMGPSFWSSGAAPAAARTGALAGAWYALPDPATRQDFVASFTSHYGVAPTLIADLAFDATLIGRVLAQEHDFSQAALTRPDGFSGVDGALLLLPDGHVHRALAIFQLQPDGSATIVSPAPAALDDPGAS